MPSKQKKSTASEETEELDDDVEETEPSLKERTNGLTHGDTTKKQKSRTKHKSTERSEIQELPEKEKNGKEGDKVKEKQRKKRRDDEAKAGAVIESKDGQGEQNNNEPTTKPKKEKSKKPKEEVTDGVEEEKKKQKKKSSAENPEGEEEMGSKDKKSKDGKKKKKSHNDDDEEPLIEEQEEEDSKKKKKKKAKKGSADSDEDKKKKGKKSKNKQLDYAVIYQEELLNYHTDSSDGYEDEYYKKKGKHETMKCWWGRLTVYVHFNITKSQHSDISEIKTAFQ